LNDLNGAQYSTLNPKAARILRNGILRIILIFKESHPDIKYEIFIRLNRGSIKLTEQELRNCLYRGQFNELLKELRENPNFLEMLGLSKPHKRMMDASLVLRYFTIAEAYDSSNNGLFESYQGKVLSSMNKFMELKKKISQEEIEVFKKRFNDTVEKVYSVFGTNAFRKFDATGSLESPRLNRAIMDMVMVSFEYFSKSKLLDHKQDILKFINFVASIRY